MDSEFTWTHGTGEDGTDGTGRDADGNTANRTASRATRRAWLRQTLLLGLSLLVLQPHKVVLERIGAARLVKEGVGGGMNVACRKAGVVSY